MIIIKYHEWMKIRPSETFPVYELCRKDPKAPDGYKTIKRLHRTTAEGLIEGYRLKLVHENDYGQIWKGGPEELPEGAIDEDGMVRVTEAYVDIIDIDFPDEPSMEDFIAEELINEFLGEH